MAIRLETEDPGPPSSTRILRAALEEFETHGYAGARVDRIAASAQANKQLVYRYFGDKRGLYEAAVKELIRALRASDADAVEHGESFLRRLAPEEGARPMDASLRATWTRILSWEALEPVDRSDSAVRFIRENYTEYVDSLRNDPDAANALARFPARFVFALLLAASRLPYSTPAAFAAALGKESADEEDVAEWLQFVRQFVASVSSPQQGTSSEPRHD